MLTYGQDMSTHTRMSGAARREAILEAVKRVFAERGFDGTTTRELAMAAGVSEALLYKHFPSKESLYAAMRGVCANGPLVQAVNRIMALEASTSTLVILSHFLVSHFVVGCPREGGKSVLNRLMARSLLEDGEFARLTLKQTGDTWVGKFESCLKAASKAGDLRDIPVRPDLRFWFTHHIAVILMLHLQPEAPAIDYRVTKDGLVEQATWFALLGVGVKDEAIRRHYNPKAWALLAD